MCLAVPGEIMAIRTDDALMRMSTVQFGGVTKEVSLAYVPEAEVGDYVIVHVGFAISMIDRGEAMRVFEYLEQMGDLEELQDPA